MNIGTREDHGAVAKEMLPFSQYAEKRGSLFNVLLACSSIQCSAPHNAQITSDKDRRAWRNEGLTVMHKTVRGGLWVVGAFVTAVLFRSACFAIRRRSLKSEVRRTRRSGCLAIMKRVRKD